MQRQRGVDSLLGSLHKTLAKRHTNSVPPSSPSCCSSPFPPPGPSDPEPCLLSLSTRGTEDAHWPSAPSPSTAQQWRKRPRPQELETSAAPSPKACRMPSLVLSLNPTSLRCVRGAPLEAAGAGMPIGTVNGPSDWASHSRGKEPRGVQQRQQLPQQQEAPHQQPQQPYEQEKHEQQRQQVQQVEMEGGEEVEHPGNFCFKAVQTREQQESEVGERWVQTAGPVGLHGGSLPQQQHHQEPRQQQQHQQHRQLHEQQHQHQQQHEQQRQQQPQQYQHQHQQSQHQHQQQHHHQQQQPVSQAQMQQMLLNFLLVLLPKTQEGQEMLQHLQGSGGRHPFQQGASGPFAIPQNSPDINSIIGLMLRTLLMQFLSSSSSALGVGGVVPVPRSQHQLQQLRQIQNLMWDLHCMQSVGTPWADVASNCPAGSACSAAGGRKERRSSRKLDIDLNEADSSLLDPKQCKGRACLDLNALPV